MAGDLLVPRRDQADPIPGVVEGIQQADVAMPQMPKT
jgi:hypothetical protein